MSQYFINLDNKSQERYAEKIKNIGNMDEIHKNDISMDTLLFPSITSFDIINYFLFALTKEELKAFKGLESYNQFVSGWVKEVWCQGIWKKHSCLWKSQTFAKIEGDSVSAMGDR